MLVSPPPFVDPAGLASFLEKEYISGYIKDGGAKFKLILGSTGCGKTAFLRRLEESTRTANYVVVPMSARTTQLGRLDDFYRQVMGAVDIDSLIKRVAHQTIRNLGYDPAEVGEAPFLEWAGKRGRPQSSINRLTQEELEKLYLHNGLTADFAAAVVFLTYSYLLGQPDTSREVVLSWLKGYPTKDYRLLAQVGIHKRIDAYVARNTLRSLLNLLHFVGIPGLAILIDDLDQLTVTGKQPDGFISYSRQKCADTYESIRQFIDDSDFMPGLFLVCASRDSISHDQKRGIPSYAALQNRLVEEVQANEFNRFVDVLNLDKAWQLDWPRQRSALIEEWRKTCRDQGRTPPDLPPDAFPYAGLVSPVRRIVDHLDPAREGGIVI